MTKPRNPSGRVGPAATVTSPLCLYGAYCGVGGRPSAGYVLRPAPHHEQCDVKEVPRFDLCGTMSDRAIGETPRAFRVADDWVLWVFGLNKPRDRDPFSAASLGFRLTAAASATRLCTHSQRSRFRKSGAGCAADWRFSNRTPRFAVW